MSLITPNWTDAVSPTGASGGQTLSLGSVLEGTLDLRTKGGAMLTVELGRKGATAPASAVKVNVYRVINDDVAPAPKSLWCPLASSTAASNATTVGADSASGQRVLTVASGTGYVAGDSLCIYDTAFTRLEYANVSKVSGTTVTLDRKLQYTHTLAQADNVTRVADLFNDIWLVGGSLYAVVFDYGAAATGADFVVRATAQTYDSDSVV